MKYEPALDGLRALAILPVVLFHVDANMLPGGWIGVEIFFVLSGYLITRILAAEIRNTGRIDFRKFYYFRFLRLAPALLLLLAFILFLALYSTKNRDLHLRSILASLFYYMNWSRAFEDWSGGLLAHTWSLSIEEQFYLLWPLVLLGLLRSRKAAWYIAAFIVAVVLWRTFLHGSGTGWHRTYLGSDTHCDGLLLGAWAAVVGRHRLQEMPARYICVPIAILLTMLFTVSIDSAAAQTWGISVAALAAVWVLVGMEGCPRLRVWLSHRWLVFTGRISYGWYLWHMPIFIMAKYNFKFVNLAHEIATYIAMFFGSYALAAVSYKMIESPVLQLKGFYGKTKSAAREA